MQRFRSKKVPDKISYSVHLIYMQKALRNPTYICSTCVIITIFLYSTCILIDLLPITQSCLSIPNDVLHGLSFTPNINGFSYSLKLSSWKNP